MYIRPITFSSSVSEEEYCAFKLLSVRPMMILTAFSTPLAVIGLAGKALRLTEWPWPAWIGLYIAGVAGVFIWRMLSYMPHFKENYRKSTLGETVAYTFQPDGLSYVADGKTIMNAWDTLHSYKETKRFFMVYFSERQCLLFPKDRLRNADEIDLIRQHISVLAKHKYNLLDDLSTEAKIRYAIVIGLLAVGAIIMSVQSLM